MSLTLPLLLPADHDSEAKITDCSEHMTTIRSTSLLSSDKRENVCDLRIKEQGGSARWWIRVSLSSDVEWCHFDNDCDSDGRRERQLAFKWWPSPHRYHRFNPNRNDVYFSSTSRMAEMRSSKWMKYSCFWKCWNEAVYFPPSDLLHTSISCKYENEDMESFGKCIAYSFQCLEIRDFLSDSEDLPQGDKDGR